MSRFLKLSNMVINKNVIKSIEINKDKYFIQLMTDQTNGLFIFGVGYCHSSNTEVEVCKIKNLSDYEKITNWIDNELK